MALAALGSLTDELITAVAKIAPEQKVDTTLSHGYIESVY